MYIGASVVCEVYCYRLVSRAVAESPDKTNRRKQLLKVIREKMKKFPGEFTRNTDLGSEARGF